MISLYLKPTPSIMKRIFLLVFIVSLCIFTASAQYTTLLNFNGTNGSTPYGSLITDGTYLYGMTPFGGSHNSGTIFKIKPDGTGEMTLLSFDTANGSEPYGSLFYNGTYLYGMARYGGVNNDGVIFRIDPSGSNDTILFNFNGTNGSNPQGSLYSDGTYLYGMTYGGGKLSEGVIFRIKPNGTSDTVLLSFNGTTGQNPYLGSLISDGTFLYGMTSFGGIHNDGVIFRIKSDGTRDSVLLNFNVSSSGNQPNGSLYYDGTYLYGMTSTGGTSNSGVVFRIKPDGTGDTNLLNFNGTNGAQPFGSLISDGTYLYGMTSDATGFGDGAVFKILPNGTKDSVLFYLNSLSYPYGSLFYDGTSLYGMTSKKGTNNDGILFKCSKYVVGIAELNSNMDFNLFPNPSTGKFILQFNQPPSANSTGLSMSGIVVYNVLGEKVYSIDNRQLSVTNFSQTIDISNQPDGVYFLQIQTIAGMAVKKIIIQK